MSFEAQPIRSGEIDTHSEVRKSCFHQVMTKIFSVSTVSAAVLACFAGATSATEGNATEVASFQEFIDYPVSDHTTLSVPAFAETEAFNHSVVLDGTNKSLYVTGSRLDGTYIGRPAIQFIPASKSDSFVIQNFGQWSGNWRDYVEWKDCDACWTNDSYEESTVNLNDVEGGLVYAVGVSVGGTRTFFESIGGNITISNSVLPSLNGGYITELFTISDGATLKIENSVIGSSKTDQLTNAITVDSSNIIISNSLFLGKNPLSLGASSSVKEQAPATLLYIEDSAFIGGSPQSTPESIDYGVDAINLDGYIVDKPYSNIEVVIKNTMIEGFRGSAVGVRDGNAGNVYISDSYFARLDTQGPGSSFGSRGGVEVTIRDTSYTETLQAIQLHSEEGTMTLNVIAENKPTVLASNGELYRGSSWYVTTYKRSDIEIKGDATVNLNAAEGQNIQLHAGAAHVNFHHEYDDQGVHYDSWQPDDYTIVNINKDAVNYSYTDYSQVEENGVSKDVYTTVNSTAPRGGEVQIYAPMYYLDIRTYGGAIRLLPPDIEQVAQEDLQNKAAISGLSADTDDHFTNIFLKDSCLTVEEDTTLKTQTVDPFTHEASTARDEVELLLLKQNVRFQTIMLGNKLTLNANLLVEPAVDLVTGESDSYRLAGDSATISGNGKIAVNGWIVKADNTDNAAVKIDLTPSEEKQLGAYFDITAAGKTAYGPIYVWDVIHTAGTSEFTFVKRGPESELDKPGAKDDIEDEIKKDIDEAGEQDLDGASLDDKDELQDLLAKVEETNGTHLKNSPINYNPDVYGEQVAVLGVSVVQNAISDAVFSEMRIGQLGHLIAGDKPERKEWWGKVTGADLNLKTKNFYKLDVDYALALIGHQFSPIATDAGNFLFGAYVGAVSAHEKYSISRVRQNGGLIGGSVLFENGNAWVGVHANVGVMTNHLKGITDNKTSNPWVGLGVSGGYNFVIPQLSMAFTPFVDLSYVAVKAKDYTTNLGAEVKNASLRSFEVSPGFSVDKKFAEGWGVHGQARYAIVSKHDGKTQATYNNDNFVSLPSIANKNYVEYGVGLLKHTKNWGFALNANRSDGGRTGWSGMARVSYRF